MNYILILGVIGLIVVIAVIAYFMLGNKGIKDGKYIVKQGDRNKTYIIVSKDNVELGDYFDDLPRKKMDFKLIKSGMTFKFDDKELPLFEASIPIDNRPAYFAQSSDDSIFILTRDNSGSLIVAPVKLVPTLRI
jgi:hypothetical protein